MKCKTGISEEAISISASGAFYNPEMKFCRGIFSLAVGAIGEEINVLDAFCASGARGIRYSKENKNVGSVTFLDWSKNCIKLAKANSRKNKVTKAKFAEVDVTRFLIDNFYDERFDFNFIELDPFGTPSPYLYPAFFSMQKKKVFYLSATATDTAVLCGPETNACMKNYHSKSLNNEFTHENGLRILIKRIAEVAAEFNFGIEPLFSISDRHYLKTLVRCENNAVKADHSMKLLGYTSSCSCGWRVSGKRAAEKCERCGKETDYGGKFWLGDISSADFVNRMVGLNNSRKYSNQKEIANVLDFVKHEVGLPPWYFNIHKLCKRIESKSVPKLDCILKSLSNDSFNAFRTHFSPVSIKTDAPVEEVENAIRYCQRVKF